MNRISQKSLWSISCHRKGAPEHGKGIPKLQESQLPFNPEATCHETPVSSTLLRKFPWEVAG